MSLDINNSIELLNYPSNNSYSKSIITNLDFPSLNKIDSYKLNNIEILYPSPINSQEEEESLSNIYEISNFNKNIINMELSKSAISLNKSSDKIFSDINCQNEESKESLINICEFSKINNNIINTNISKSTISSSKIFSVIKSEKPKLRDNIKKIYIKKEEKHKKLNRKKHTGFDNDNIIRKIQVHFINFIIFFCNDVILNLIGEKKIPKFQQLDHKLKKYVSFRKIEWFKNLTVAEIIKLKISPKIKRHDIDVNSTIYNEVCELNPFIQDYLKIKYSDLFKEYYNNKNKLLNVNGTIIHLSEKTKTFNDLINKKKYYKYRQKFNYISINHFLKCYKRVKKPRFKTSIRK